MIGAYPGILLEVFNCCLREGRFFADFKKQRLVLLRKSNKPLGDASSYRPICLLDKMGKLLEELILQRLQVLLVGENGLSAYRTVSTSAVLVLDSAPLIDLSVEERKETFQLRK